MKWNKIKNGPPPCDSETVFIGVNSAGFCGCFNEYHRDVCYYRTAKDHYTVMAGLFYWAVLEKPSKGNT